MSSARNLIRLIIAITLNSITFQGMVLAEVKVCDIKYNQKELEEKRKNKSISNLFNNKKGEKCHFIGNEYDRHGNELPEKPIYACCLSNS